MITGSARLTNKLGFAKAAILEHLADTIDATGEEIAEETKTNMTPGHFYDEGTSHDFTEYNRTGRLSGVVQVRTEYAAYPEFGTSNMAPRPALTPAIQKVWPSFLRKTWEVPGVHVQGPIVGQQPPVDRDGNPL